MTLAALAGPLELAEAMPLTGADAAQGEAGHDDRRSRATPDATACRAGQGSGSKSTSIRTSSTGGWCGRTVISAPCSPICRVDRSFFPTTGARCCSIRSAWLGISFVALALFVLIFTNGACAWRQISRPLSGAARDRLRRANPAGLGRALELFSVAARLYEPGLLRVVFQYSPVGLAVHRTFQRLHHLLGVRARADQQAPALQ